MLSTRINTGGESLVRAARQLAHDLATPPRLPATVDTRQFEVGRNLATSPGSVVLRTDVFELIQYKPSTEQVREVPLLFVPPTINKFYVLDISPGRSTIEHYAGTGSRERCCSGAIGASCYRAAVISNPWSIPPPASGAASRASYRVADALPDTADEFLARAPTLSGSWWCDWERWLAERSGELKPTPKALGNRAHKAPAKAPGTYVLAH